MSSEQSLYRRLGGYDVIAAVIDDLFGRLKADPQFARFAAGRSNDSRQRARQLLVDQMCELTGGSCAYIGRDMRTSHAGLGITNAEWEANLVHTAAALEHHGIRDPEKAEFLAIFERFRGEIVEGPTDTGAG